MQCLAQPAARCVLVRSGRPTNSYTMVANIAVCSMHVYHVPSHPLRHFLVVF